ncbi:Arginase/deacetylase, partial [Viridothelium virens]
MHEKSTRELPQSRNTDFTVPASPKAQLPSIRSPQISRGPSLGITVQKGPQRSQSSMSNHALSSPALDRRVSSSSLTGGGDFSAISRPMRRASSGLPHSSPVRASSRASLHAPIEDPQHHTAASVASAYLERELAVHQEQNSEADTVVILHDDCYGHRFSRPKTTKGTLSLIVERPERLHASVLGLSAAYIRLGGRHSEGRQPPHPEREIDRRLPFLVRKTARMVDISSPCVTNVHGKAWMDELKTMCNSASTNLASTGKELTRTPNGSSQSDSSPKHILHEGDLYLSPESLNAFQGALGGVCEGIDAIFENAQKGHGPSKAFVCIRPPGHHCSSDLPSGFCWLNNVHVGIEYAAQNYGLTHAVILDFDLHHGDGSQSIAWARNSRVAKMPKNTSAAKKLAIGYYSLHDINSFPCEWGEDDKVQNASLCIENAHNQSVWNVHLEPWKTEADFWALYENKYSVLFEKALSFLRFQADRLRTSSGNILPRAAIFVSAGFDASQWEGQGMQRHKVNVPTDFFARFTGDVVKLAQEPGLGVDGRVISVLEGGYSDKALISGVMSHLSGLTRGKSQTETVPADTTDGLGIEMGRRMGALSLDEQDNHAKEQHPPAYSCSWWNAENLSALEGLIAPPPAAPAPKKRTTASNTSHYTSPTQSFTAKVVDPTKIYRSTSGYSTLPTTSTEPVVIPVPEVDWLTAVGELSKLLIPQNRQTKSCRPEELSEPRVKKERKSINALPSAESMPPAGRMQLRERKTKAPTYAEPKSEDDSIPGKAPSKADRRRTIADVSS